MKFQHLTKKDNIEKIQSNGFSLDFVGQNGGDQMGTGIYLTRHPENWKIHLDDRGLETIVVEVEMDNIINYSDIDQEAVRAWMIKNGYLTGNEESLDDLPEKTAQIVAERGENDSFKWLTAQYLKEAGFAGYWYRDVENRGYFEQLVVWDLSAIV